MNYLLVLLSSVILSCLGTPLVKKIAYKINAIDVPKDERRVHTKPIPRLGGLAIYFSFMITIIIFSNLSNTKLVGMVLGATLITSVGILDDVKELSAKVKLAAQIIAALILMKFGFRIDFITNFFGDTQYLYLGMLSIPVTLIWIVGITNTVNLIDGLDGLAAGISMIASFMLAYIAYTSGRVETSILTLALGGACLGFLPYNFNPAKIFMGDTGALFLGFVLSAISIDGAIKSPTILAVGAPVLILGVPIFDTAFAIIRRYLNGKPIMSADKGHLHHRLLSKGLSQKKTVLILYLISIILGISGIVLSKSQFNDAIILLAVIGILLIIPFNKMVLFNEDLEKN